MGMCCEKTLIGWRNVWNMRWRAPDQEVDQRGRKEVVQKDCQARNLNEDAMDHGRWKKLIKIGWWSGWWVGECLLVPTHPGSPRQRAVKWLSLLLLLFSLSWNYFFSDSLKDFLTNFSTSTLWLLTLVALYCNIVFFPIALCHMTE